MTAIEFAVLFWVFISGLVVGIVIGKTMFVKNILKNLNFFIKED